MRKILTLSLFAAVAVASAAEARGPVAPGEFVTGLSEADITSVITQTDAMFPGVTLHMSYDVVRGTWTVESREFGESNATE